MSASDERISVSIVGGRIGGLCLAIGLRKYPHLNVHVYEAAASLGEIGAGVSIDPNFERALVVLGPEALSAFRKHATPRGRKGRRQPHPLPEESLGMQSVHQAHFLDELVKAVPVEGTHFHKCLEILEEGPAGVTLCFKDGQSTVADAAIGADGIRGHTREYLIGEELVKARFSGSVVHRGLVPMEAAVEVLGKEHAHNCTMLCGPETEQ
ncbi:MAG: hypothetical protein Q9216_004961 [Gyalolechia sp. 2 TL-2023]